MHLSKEEQIMYNHFDDMYNLADRRGIPVFSDFVSLNEVNLVYMLLEEKGINRQLQDEYLYVFGGYDQAERNMVCFLPQNSYQEIEEKDFPIACVRIAPVNKKFCDALTHRDYLGTIMNIGLERNQIGDIVVKNEGNGKNDAFVAYVFCRKNKAELLTDITRIRHTTVSAEIIEGTEISFEQQYKEIAGSVSSLRIDSIISVAAKTSRTKSLTYIREGNVFLNGRCCTENAKIVSEGDVISIRGFGKYKIGETGAVTKKGRYHVTVLQYI